jgi:hypothetical protein
VVVEGAAAERLAIFPRRLPMWPSRCPRAKGLYPGDQHLFADNSLPGCDEIAATLLKQAIALAWTRAVVQLALRALAFMSQVLSCLGRRTA